MVAEFDPKINGMYALHFEDDTGLASTRLFDLRIFPDPPPTVTLDRPSKSHDSLELLPRAEFTLELTAEDQQFAVHSVYLQYRCKKDDLPRKLPLYDHETAGQAVSQVLAALAQAPSLPPRLRPQRTPIRRRLALEQFKHVDGNALTEGDVFILQAAATDFDDVNVFKEPGKSHEVEIRIVSPAALERILDRAQAQVQQELLRLHKEQLDALKQVIGAEQQWKNTGKLQPKELDQLLQAEQTQQQIRDRVGAKKDEGLRAEVARVLQALRDNKLPRSGTHDRMETVAADLDRLAREQLEQIEAALTNARKENDAAASNPNANRKAAEKNQIAEARQRQEEVENTLSELLKLLEPWGRIKDIRNEAKDILHEQRQLGQETKKLNKENTQGVTPDKLSNEQKGALDGAAKLQNRLGERADKLLDQLKRVAAERQNKDPDTANALKDAAKQGEADNLVRHMKSAAQNLQENKLSTAGENQQRSAESMEKVVKALDDNREKELEQLSKKLKDVEKQLDDLARDQEELRKKTQEAGKIGDAKKRDEELKRLAREQEKLRKKAQELSAELKRLRPDRAAARDLDRAAGGMDQAGQMLERDGDADQSQEEALARLNDAQRRLRQAQEEVEEELAREKLAKVADQIKGLKERQEAAHAEAERIEKLVLDPRLVRASLGQLAQAQDGLAEETKSLAEGRLAGARVFTHVLSKSAAAMESAAQQLKMGTTNPAPATVVPDAKKRQKEASRRLGQLLDALKPDQGVSQRAGGEGGDGGGAGGRAAPGDDIPPLAELKALRGLQKDVNDRTEAFAKKHPDSKMLSPENAGELKEIRQEQQDVADLLDKMTQPEEAAPKEDAKPAKRTPERKLPNVK